MKHLDAILVITLEEATSRQERMRNNYPNVDLEFMIYGRDKESGERGCFTSHQKALEHAKKKKYKNILILEDDAAPLKKWDKITNYIEKFLENPPDDWILCSLGYLPIRVSKTKQSNILKIKCAFNTHAYLVNVEKAPILPWEGVALDSELFCKKINHKKIAKSPKKLVKGDHMKGIYAHIPMLFKQDAQESFINKFDLAQRHFYNFFGGYDQSALVAQNFNTVYFGIFIFLLIFLLILLMVSFRVKNKQFNVSMVVITVVFIICWGFLFSIDGLYNK